MRATVGATSAPPSSFTAVRPAFGEEAAGVAKRVLGAGLVAHERHVGHDSERVAPRATAAVCTHHVVHGDRQRGVVAEHGHAEGVAHEDRVDAGRVDQPRRRVRRTR